jgi:hypothetical protein
VLGYDFRDPENKIIWFEINMGGKPVIFTAYETHNAQELIAHAQRMKTYRGLKELEP